MMKRICTVAIFLALAFAANAQEPRHGIRTGTVQQVDEHAKTITIKSEDGTEHTLQIEARTKFHGVHGNSRNTTDKIQGLKPGTQVAAHYTAAGTAENAVEIDNIGPDGLKTMQAHHHPHRSRRKIAHRTNRRRQQPNLSHVRQHRPIRRRTIRPRHRHP